MFSEGTFTAALRNSIGIALLATIISIVLAAMAAYAITRLEFSGKALILSGALAIAMFPPISIVGSLFDLWRRIGLFDTWLGLIIPYMTFTLPLAIYTLSAFFREIPWDLDKAAQVDRATPWQAFTKVMVPLAAPGVFTAAILVFIFAWNDFLFAIVLTSTDSVTHGPGSAGVLHRRVAVHRPDGCDRRRGGGRHDSDHHHGPRVPAPHRRGAHGGRGQGLGGEDMADIVFDKVTKRYPDGYEAVKGIDLEIADGEFMILVGPSGCGKSTALNMIAGLEDISSGELRIGGEVVNDKAPRDRDIAMVFQSYALYPHMSVRENMAFPLTIVKTPKDEVKRRVEEAAELLDLNQHLDRKPSQLSGGQRQRVAMGRAIVRSPKAFLMDEPLSNLDAKLRVQMRTSVARLQDQLGTTMVYVTHDQTEAMTLGDRVAIMRAGDAAAGRDADGALRQAQQPVRGRLHRLAVDELPPGDRRGRHDQVADGRRQAAGVPPRGARAHRGGQAADRGHPAGGLRGRRGGRRRRPARRSRPRIDVLEAMGSEFYAHFTIDAKKGELAQSDELRELQEDAGGEAPGSGDGLRRRGPARPDEHREAQDRVRDLGQHGEDPPLRPRERQEPGGGMKQAAAPAGLALAGVVVLLVWGGTTAGIAVAMSLIGVACVIAVSLVFLAIGRAEDAEREAALAGAVDLTDHPGGMRQA